MARSDYAGVPDQTPQLEAPNDYQRVDATPASFGAQVAQAGQSVGANLMKASDFYGEVAADNGVNNAIQQATRILRGDPSKGVMTDPTTGTPVTGPDGTPVYNGGYFGLRGADAMTAAKETDQQLQDTIAEQRENLTTPESRLKYDTEVRRYYNQWQNEMGEHYDQQFQNWTVTTADNRAALTQNAIPGHMSDPALLAQDQETLRRAYVQKETAQFGHTEDVAQGGVLKADQAFYLTQISASVVTDPARAQQALEAGRSVLASLPNYDQIVQRVRTANFNAVTGPSVDTAVSSIMTDAQRAVQGSTPQAVPAGARPPAPPGVAAVAGAHIARPTGAAYDEIGQLATQQRATPVEIDTLQRIAHAESRGNPDIVNASDHKGWFQFDDGTFAGAGGTDMADHGQQVSAALRLMRQNEAWLSHQGLPATATNLYVLHGEGPGGGHAILTAPPDASAVATLTPAYRGNTHLATEAVASNMGLPYRTPEQRTAANAAAQTVTNSQVISQWGARVGGPAPTGGAGGTNAAAGPYLSTADYLRANMPNILAQQHTVSEQMFPGDPASVERRDDMLERRLNQTVTQQDQSYLVDAHDVQSFMVTKKPISQEELEADPNAGPAWQRMQLQNPLAASSVQRMFDANAKGVAATYGTEFKGYIDRVFAPQGDPNIIKNPSGLWGSVSSGDDAPLTNAGVASLSGLMKLRDGSPAGEAFATQARQFIDQMHGELTYSNPGVGRYDVQGEARFTKFMAAVLPGLENAYRGGTLAKALDPNSPDYLGKAALPFMRTRAQMMRDAVTDPQAATGALTVQSLTQLRGTLDNDAQWQETLRAAVAGGRLTQPVYDAYLASQAPPAAAPGPALSAPPPSPGPTTASQAPLAPGIADYGASPGENIAEHMRPPR